MKTRYLSALVVVLVALTAAATIAADPISGQWEGKFDAMGTLVPFKMMLKLDGDKITGSLESEHTGPGKATDGIWKDGTFSMTMVFEKHQSIEFTGKPTKDGLEGEFKTEGFTAKWAATKSGRTQRR
jgi:hypothetical protein